MQSDIRDASDVPHDHRVGNCVITIHPDYALTLTDGTVWRFDFHKYLGPTFLRKDGEPRTRPPGERNPVWDAYGLWEKQGRRVDAQNNAIWEPCQDSAA
jgi:hypothetical protein